MDNKICFTTTDTIDDIINTAEKAVKLADLSQSTMFSFPLKKNSFNKVGGIYDRSIIEDQIDSQVNALGECIDSTEYDVVDGNLSLNSSEMFLLNSCGIERKEKKTIKSVNFSLTDGNITRFSSKTRTKNFRNKEVLEKSEDLLRRSEQRKNIDSGSKTVVLTPHAQRQIFSGLLFPAFNADNVQRGKSFLDGKKGEEVFSDSLSITDNGLMEGGVGTKSFDREGTSSQKTELVEKGVVKNFLYDVRRAEKDGVESTGNASGSPSSSPGISPTNMVFDGEKQSLDGLEDYVLIDSVSGVHTADVESGDYSLNILCGFIKDEGREYGIKSGMLVGNIVSLLKNFSHMAGDKEKSGRLVTSKAVFEDQNIVV